MSNIWLLLLSRVRVRRPRWFVPFVTVLAIGITVAGLIYAIVVFKAIDERNSVPHVHAHSTR